MNFVIACLLVTGCLAAPSGNSAASNSTTNSTSNSTSQLTGLTSSLTNSGKSVIYSVTQKFSFGLPNLTSSSSGNVVVTHTTLPFGPSPSDWFAEHNKEMEAMRNRTQQSIANMERQNKKKFALIHSAVQASHQAIQSSINSMFNPFKSSRFFG